MRGPAVTLRLVATPECTRAGEQPCDQRIAPTPLRSRNSRPDPLQFRPMLIRYVPIVTVLAVIITTPTPAQERFSFFQASTPENVQRMLTMAGLRDDDVLVDLGSGDGLIPLTAARMNSRLRGFGVDIDPKLVDESNQKAKEEGLADRVR